MVAIFMGYGTAGAGARCAENEKPTGSKQRG
jgi:hypothetical protein